MFRKFAIIALLAGASSCARQDPNQSSFAPPSQVEEQPGAPVLEDAPAEVRAEEASEPAREAELDDSASPSVARPADADAEASKTLRSKKQPQTSSPITGCSSETCIKECKRFGATKQAECATAFAAGCFEPTRDPLQCGAYGIADEKPKSGDAVEEMPTPRLY